MKMKTKNGKLVYDILWFVAVIVLVVRFIFKAKTDTETTEALSWMLVSLTAAIVLVILVDRFFPHWFNNRKSREEFEQDQHRVKE